MNRILSTIFLTCFYLGRIQFYQHRYIPVQARTKSATAEGTNSQA